jgi:hypothetical protein
MIGELITPVLNVKPGVLFATLPTFRDSHTFHLRGEGVLEECADKRLPSGEFVHGINCE